MMRMNYYYEEGRYWVRPERAIHCGIPVYAGEPQESKFDGVVGDDIIRILDEDGRVLRSVFSEERLRKARRQLEDHLRKNPEMILTAAKAINFQV